MAFSECCTKATSSSSSTSSSQFVSVQLVCSAGQLNCFLISLFLLLCRDPGVLFVALGIAMSLTTCCKDCARNSEADHRHPCDLNCNCPFDSLVITVCFSGTTFVQPGIWIACKDDGMWGKCQRLCCYCNRPQLKDIGNLARLTNIQLLSVNQKYPRRNVCCMKNALDLLLTQASRAHGNGKFARVFWVKVEAIKTDGEGLCPDQAPPKYR
mmetsp:Transcript_12458/g.23862  ORF Transcript_12458/g.23862 Transcript_12458/m.23862 type:complete len:211 (+) Transcript_12458:271-903(+)